MTGSMALPSLMTTLIPWAISSVLLILAVLAVRWLTRDRLSSVNRYTLWLVVLIRLLIPIQLPFLSSLGAVDLAPQMENTPVYAFPTGHMDAPERYIQHIREEQGEDPVMSAGVTSRSFPALGGSALIITTAARSWRRTVILITPFSPLSPGSCLSCGEQERW